MQNDPVRAAVQKRELEIKIEALMREEAVVNYYATRGYRVISTDDDETRKVLGIPPRQPAADILAVRGNQLVIAEVKGSDIDRALTQLRNTAMRALGRYGHIACKVFVKNQAPTTDSADLRGGGSGLSALRVFRRSFPGEWVLYEYDANRNSKPVQIGSEPVCIVFGPHV